MNNMYWEGEFIYNGDLFYAKVDYTRDDYCTHILEFDIIDIDDINVFDPSEDMLNEIEYKIDRHVESIEAYE